MEPTVPGSFAASFRPKRWWIVHHPVSAGTGIILDPGTRERPLAELVMASPQGGSISQSVPWRYLFLSGRFEFLNFSTGCVEEEGSRLLTNKDSFTALDQKYLENILTSHNETIFRRYIYQFSQWRRINGGGSLIPEVVNFDSFHSPEPGHVNRLVQLRYEQPVPFFKFLKRKIYYKEAMSKFLSSYKPVEDIPS